MKTTTAIGLGLLILAATSPARATPDPMTRQQILDLAASGVGYSYWWGNGSWRTDGQQPGSCSGTCPGCSHSGNYGADCSGFVAKAWQVPGPSDVTVNAHPYSTSSFRWESTHWSQIPRGDALPGDAFVYRNAANTSGHVVIYESGDPWGSSWVYEARGCAYGVVHRLKSISSEYVAIRRDALTESVCEPVPPAGRVIDEKEPCFEAGGPTQYWRTESAGYDSGLTWTHAVDTQVYNYGVWHLDLEQAGRYRIEAYTDAAWAESQQARYQIHASGATVTVQVDQTAVDGWVTIGEADFAAGPEQWVRLEDLTGEPGSTETRVLFDALRLTPAQPGATPVCEPVPPAGRVIDETEPCFEAGGPAQYWRTEAAGWDESLRWTHAVSTSAYNYGVWHLDLEQAGRYRIEAYTDAAWAESRQARYQVHASGATVTVQVDQTAVDGWVTLGEADFAAGGAQWVRLEDLTGEPGSSETRVVFDALRLTAVQPGAEPTCAPIPPSGRIVDESELCVELGGPAQYWRAEQAGYHGALRWTHATASQAYNYAVWRLDFEQAGQYRIEAYTAAPWAESRQARYQVHHQGYTQTIEVDQTAVDGWTVVGELYFDAGAGQWVRLEDLTGEPGSSDTRVVVDALRVTRVSAGYGTSGGADDPGRDLVGATGGCQLSTAADASGCWLLLLALLVIGRVRRGRRRPAS